MDQSAAAAIPDSEAAAAIAAKSSGAAAEAAGTQFLSELQALQVSVVGRSLKPARLNYIRTVAALKAWATAAKVDGQLIGL